MIRLILTLITLSVVSQAQTYKASQVTYQDCYLIGCGGKVKDGDTSIFTAWSATGFHTMNGVTKPGALYGTTNDSNIHYNGDPNLGPNCEGRSIQWLKIPSVNVAGNTGTIYSSNCMASYSSVQGDLTWTPATAGTCYAGDVGGGGGSPSDCDWKSQGMICVDANCYLNVLRQGRASSVHPFRGYDSTLIRSNTQGFTWLNPSGGVPDVNGAAPAGPGDSTYPASILWPDPAPHDGVSQHVGRLEFIQYGQDGATWPSVDNNATYIYALTYSGQFGNYYLARVVRANMTNLSASDWSYYKCATYSTAACDGSSNTFWDSNQANATAITTTTTMGLGGAMYDANLGIYIGTGGNVSKVAIATAPHPWGPWTSAGSLAYAPVPGANLGFVSPLMSSVVVTNAGRSIQFSVSATEYNHSPFAGTTAYLTYELVKVGGASGGGSTTSVLFPLPVPIAIPTSSGDFITDVNATNTQAVLSYTSPIPGSACLVEVSESASYTPLVKDVNPLLFSGSNSDGGSTASRTFVVGKRVVELALDTLYYSRALQADTTHYFRITCGPTTSTGVFITQNIPVGSTYQDTPQLDTANPGLTVQPSIISTGSITDRSQTIVDPKTGSLIKRVTINSDSPYNPSNPATFGSFLYYSGAPRVCGIPTVGPDGGNLCKFAQGDGGPDSLYYIIPATGEARYLGWGRPGTLNESNNKFYSHADLPSHAIIENSYTGTYVDRTNGFNAVFTPTTLMANLQTSVAAFDATFDAANFDCYPVTAVGDYLHFSCSRSQQDSSGWVGAVRISTASVVAAARVDANIKCRWCALHQTVPSGYTEPVFQIIPHEYTGDQTGNQKGQGPYKTTLTSGVNNSTTTIPVAGEPDCIPCGADTTVPLARVGDVFQIGTELVQITTKTSPTSWEVTRGFRSTTAASHLSSDVVLAACDMKVVMWKFTADPHGTDTTNTNWVQDLPWTTATDQGHDDATQNLLLSEAADGWVTRVGDNITQVNQAVTATISSNLTFGGKSANCFGNGCRKHPSAGYPASTWFTDFPLFDFVAPNGGTNTITNVSGQLYKLGAVVGTGINPKHFAIAGVIGAVFVGGGSPFSFLDISGPSSVLGTTSADNYKMCISNFANECRSGSSVGDIYFNTPTTPTNLTCGTNTDPCIANYSKYANGTIQVATDGTYGRVVSGGLSGLRKGGDFPTAKQVGSRWLLFAIGDQGFYKPSQVAMAKLPPFVAEDNVVRTTFVRAPVTITVPTGLSIAKATVEFGYYEQGTISQHYCTSRREACVAVTSAVIDATPYYFKTTDTYTKLACTTSCTIGIPVLPSHVAYYTVKFYTSGDVFVQNGDSGIAIEATVK